MPLPTFVTAPTQTSRWTVSDFYTHVRSNCMLASSNRVSDADLLGFLNEAQDEIAQETHWYRTSGSINSVDGTKEYNFPTGAFTIEEVWWNPLERKLISTTPRELEMMSYYAPDWRYASEGIPIYYYINANSAFGLHPTPDSSTASAIFVVYTALPPRATAGGDSLYHPAGHERTIEAYASWKASLRDASGEGGKRIEQYRAAWVEGLAKCKRQVEALAEEELTVMGEYGTPGGAWRLRPDWWDGSAIPPPTP